MKALLTLLLPVLTGMAGLCQPVQSSCTAPDSIKALYEFDAKVLTLREMQAVLPDSIVIPQDRVDFYLKLLLAVYNAKSLPARDSVVKCKNIHVLPPFSLNILNLGVDTTETWVANFMLSVLPTGNTVVDDLINTYHLSPGTFLPAIGALQVLSEYDLNIPALAAVFAQQPGVDYAAPSYTAGGGNDITSAPTPIENYDLYYTYGWGDCQAGCIFDHTWHFSVNPLDCTVGFLESYGNPVDFPCELTITKEAGLLEKFEVSAFNVGQLIHVSLRMKQQSVGELHLLDAGGTLVKKQTVSIPSQTEYTTEISVNGFPSGTYFLVLQLRNGVYTRKIVVQH